uniref:Pectin acetylesterase n=1 Tax=Norrisiella sphaerica TaxID=552664 RepID=A0A7S2VUL2_9EUKA
MIRSTCVLLSLLSGVFLQQTFAILHLHKLPEEIANSTGAVCLDGTPPAFYLAPAETASPKNTSWVIFFRGGGWCYDADECAERAMTDLGSTKDLSPNVTFADGVLSSDSSTNPFAAYNRAWLWYCDGASFSGDVETPVSAKGVSIYFRGHRILNEVFAYLASDFGFNQATDVLLSGCSAGGLATYLHADYIRDNLLPSSVKRFKVMPISGFFLMHDTYDGAPKYQEQMKGVFEMQNCTNGVNSQCVANHEGEEWRCMFANESAAHVTSPMFPVNSALDSWQMGNIWFGDENCVASGQFQNCTSGQIADLNKYQTDFLVDFTSSGIPNRKGNGMFIESCFEHCAANDAGFSEYSIDGIVLKNALMQWWNSSVNADPKQFSYLPCSLQTQPPHQCNPSCSSTTDSLEQYFKPIATHKEK